MKFSFNTFSNIIGNNRESIHIKVRKRRAAIAAKCKAMG